MGLALSPVLGILAVIAIVVIVAAAVLYRIYYQRRINRQLHDEAARPRRLLSPLAFTIITAFVVMLAFIGLITYIALASGADRVPEEYRNAIYKFNAFRTSELTGYRSHYSIEHNPGYTKSVEQHGDIRFTIFVREAGFDHYHPSFIVFFEYTGDEEVTWSAALGSYYTPDGNWIRHSGNGGMDFTDIFFGVGTSSIRSTVEVTAFFYGDGDIVNWPPEDGMGNAMAAETVTIRIP